jgi:hypothetical protein
MSIDIAFDPEFLIPVNQVGRTVEAPSPHAANIDVDEIRVRVITNSPAGQSQCGFAQLQRIDTGHSQINRFRQNM